MTIKRSIRTALFAAAAFTSTTAVTLSLPFYSTSFAAQAKTKMVAFRVRDDTTFPVQLHCNSQKEDVTVQPGKTISLKVAVGDALVTANSTPNYPAGTRLILVSGNLEDSTIIIHSPRQ
jgi:hypothetical protein